MPTAEEMLEILIAKVRALPPERKELAVEALTEITDPQVYVLSDEERAILEPALEDARRGENLIDVEDVDVLTKPWA